MMHENSNQEPTRGRSETYTLDRIEWDNIELYRGQMDRQQLENDLDLNSVRARMGQEKPYSAQEERVVMELTASILEECCGVFSITPDSFAVKTVSRRVLIDPTASAQVSVIDGVPYILISDVTVHWLVRSLRELQRQKINREENGIAGYVISLAHEMYHIRQFLQDRTYFEKTRVEDEEYKETKGQAYFKNRGEMGARGFALRYLREKIKLFTAKLEAEKPSSKKAPVEQLLLDSMKMGVDFLTSEVQKRATGSTGAPPRPS